MSLTHQENTKRFKPCTQDIKLKQPLFYWKVLSLIQRRNKQVKPTPTSQDNSATSLPPQHSHFGILTLSLEAKALTSLYILDHFLLVLSIFLLQPTSSSATILTSASRTTLFGLWSLEKTFKHSKPSSNSKRSLRSSFSLGVTTASRS